MQEEYTLHELGACVRESGRSEEAGEFLTRCLAIVDANLASGDTRMPSTVDHYADRHLRRVDRLEETEHLLKCRLSMCEAEVGRTNTNVDELLQKLDSCLWDEKW